MKITTALTTLLACSFSFTLAVVAGSVPQDDEPVSVLHTVIAPPAAIMGSQLGYYPTVAAPVAVVCYQQCCRRKCRCPKPAPVPMDFCLVDPCGCIHEACIEVPACCLGEPPEISWRQGVRGRQIATVCWKCCDHQAKVIVTGSGKVRVRD